MYLLMVDDDLELGRALLKLLSTHYRVEWVRTLAAARAHLAAGTHDLVVLDRGLPDGDGIDWVAELRDAGDTTPVLVITARDALDARVAGLDRGADDYLVKPFEPDELLARIRVQLRRRTGRAKPHPALGGLVLHPEERCFYLHGDRLTLTPSEYAILAVLLQAGGGRPVSRERLERQLYGGGQGAESNTLEVHIHALRRVLGRSTIETVRGFGYRLVMP